MNTTFQKIFQPQQLLLILYCGVFFVMSMGTSPRAILGGCALAVWIFSGTFIYTRDRYLKTDWFPPVTAFIILMWIGLLWSYDPSGLGLKYAKKTHYWLFAFALGSIGLTQCKAESLITCYLYGILINFFVGFMQFIDIIPEFANAGKHTGFAGGYNTLGILLNLGCLMASYYFHRSKNITSKILYFLLLLSYFFQIFILPGRGGYLTFFVLSPIIVYNLLRGKKLIYLLLTYIVAISILFSSPIVRYRVGNLFEGIKNHIQENDEKKSGLKYSIHVDRIYMWRWGLKLFVEHPVIGVGTGGYKQAILDSGGDMGTAHPHNNVLHMAASFGIVGLFVFGWLFWVLLKAGWLNRGSPVGYFILSSSLVILVGGLTDTHILDAGGATLLALTTGLVSFVPSEKARNAESTTNV